MRTRFYVILIISSLAFTGNGYSQPTDSSFLSLELANKILNYVDSSNHKNNYHLWIRDGFSNNTKIVNLWINDKLGDNTLQDVGVSICNFYTKKQGYVFIYFPKDYKINIPPDLLVRDGKSSDKLDKSPFYAEKGMHKILLIEKRNKQHYIYELSLLNEGEILEKFGKFDEFYWEN